MPKFEVGDVRMETYSKAERKALRRSNLDAFWEGFLQGLSFGLRKTPDYGSMMHRFDGYLEKYRKEEGEI